LSLLTIQHLRGTGDVRYVTWMMDDHLLRYKNGAWQYPPDIWKLMSDHLRAASQVFVISPSLGEFYRREFGVGYTVLFGPADPIAEPVWQALSKSGARLGYFGSIAEWQLDGLTKLARLLGPVNATLDVFSSISHLPSSLQLPGVTLRPQVASDAVIHKMRMYDAVVLPIGFSDTVRHLSEFNIATKMSECLASGTATLVVGPQHAAMVRFLEPYNAAWIESEATTGSVAANILSLLNTESRLERLANARDLVKRVLSTTAMRQTWLSVLNDAR
jgi:glycosyltransferase involved in cell wall biosynthesis